MRGFLAITFLELGRRAEHSFSVVFVQRHRFILKSARAELHVPANQQAPIAARLRMTDAHGLPVTAEFDWDHPEPDIWRIVVETEDGVVRLEQGGAALFIDEVAQPLPAEAEYPSLYQHFAQLIARQASDADLQPLRLVADAFMAGSRTPVAEFHD